MPLQEFLDEPTKPANTHAAYSRSMFTTEAPEWSTGEVLLGSVYRKLILGIHDNAVNLEDIVALPGKVGSNAELWGSLLLQRGGLTSPLKSGQRGTRPFRQLMPIVPSVARHACVVGSAGKRRWFPGNLLIDVLGAGADRVKAQSLLNDLAEELKVGVKDDLFARFAEHSIGPVTPSPTPSPVVIEDDRARAFRGKPVPLERLNPAERFNRDLESVLGLKPTLTRRQWTVLVEALLRIGMATHVLWACHLNSKCWEMVLAVADGQPAPTEDGVEHALWESHRTEGAFLEVGRDAMPLIKRSLERYLFGRFGLNIVLHRLEQAGAAWPADQVIGFDPASGKAAPKAVLEFLQHVETHRGLIDANPSDWLRSRCRGLCDRHLDLVKTEVGFTNNMLEFIRHSLGQIATHAPEQKSYDQSYLLANRKKPHGRSVPWVVQPGPAMLILLVHACHMAQGEIPASLDDFRMHLADYGLHAPAGELAGGQVGTDLEKLGLVVDSPDAAGGRLLVAPF